MNILIVGSGAREHALGWKISSESPGSKLFFTPGNGGTQFLGTNINKGQGESWASLAKRLGIHFSIIGPETPLADGVADQIRQAGLKVFGVSQKASRLESSKAFAKDSCRKWEIPSADYRLFDSSPAALVYCNQAKYPLVIKADGLAQGKGVAIVGNQAQGRKAIRAVMEDKIFGVAGARVVIEEFLKGHELSVMAFFDGHEFVLLPGVRDYKKLMDNEEGPNTGGMGSIAPVVMPGSFWGSFTQSILEPFRRGLEAEGILYKGLIYFGLIITKEGPKILEFNVRFGDPETQALVPLTGLPFLELMEATEEGLLSKFDRHIFFEALERSPSASVCVTLASKGYPEKPLTGYPIEGLNGSLPKGNLIFHAGTAQEKDHLITSGGRVLSVVGKGKTLENARKLAYKSLKAIHFPGMQFRSDIGQ